jgi:outer membrane autotransporter protein
MSGGDAFTVAGTPLAGNVAVIDAGLRFATSKNVTLGVSYNGQFGSNRKDNGMRAQFNLVF